METRAIVLLLIAAIAHASWNMMGKKRNPSAVFFLIATAAGVLCLAPILFWYAWLPREMPGAIWQLLLFTGICQAVYYIGLARAYKLGHISIAYPLARAIPVVLVAVVNLLIGRRTQIGILALEGMALIGVGCLLLPMKTFRELGLKHYLHASSLMALLAALGSTGYSIIDSEALRQLAHFAPDARKEDLALFYLLFEMLSSALWLLLYIAFIPAERAELRSLRKNEIIIPALAGAMIVFAYGLTLMSMSYVKNVSYVVAFRQVSIPVGVAMGIVLLKEPAPKPKLLGVTLLLAGLLMVALG